MSELELIERAAKAAKEGHAGQIYGKYIEDGVEYKAFPYYIHCEAVAGLASRYKLPAHIIAACSCHDLLEDTETTEEDLAEIYGMPPEVLNLVRAVTDAPGANRKERKAKTYPQIRKAGQEAIIVKLCDRICNVMFTQSTNNTRLQKMYDSEYLEFREHLNLGVENNWKLGYLDQVEMSLWDILDSLHYHVEEPVTDTV